MQDDVFSTDGRYPDDGWRDPLAPPVESSPRGWGCMAWFFICILVGAILFGRSVIAEHAEQLPPLDDSPQSLQSVEEIQVRLLLGFGEVLRRHTPNPNESIRELFDGDPNNPADQQQKQAMWGRGTLGQREQFAISAGELVGPERALEMLGKIKWDWQQLNLNPSQEQLAIFDTLRRIYTDYRQEKYDGPSVTDAERQKLIERLGWYGKLALTPPKSPDVVARQAVIERPYRLTVGLVVLTGSLIAAGVLGTIFLVGYSIGWFSGYAKFGLRPGSPASGIYAETFALWMFLFICGNLLVQLWPREQDHFLLSLFVNFGTLGTLMWPVLRGLSWNQVCSDIGLTWGRSGILEPFWGVIGYMMMLPMLAFGLLITLILMVAMSNAAQAVGPDSPFVPQRVISHPIVEILLRGDFAMRLQLALLACVAAPIVEEIMFRGVLYRQLRDATWKMGVFPSMVVSGLLMSFIFAVIHPQGLVAVPALMGIAGGCTLVREWRDSLWASIALHAINNGLVLSLVMQAAM